MISHKIWFSIDIDEKYKLQTQPYTYISTASFNKTSFRPLNIVRALALPQDNYVRRLKKPEESFERALESIRDCLDSWKMGAVSDA